MTRSTRQLKSEHWVKTLFKVNDGYSAVLKEKTPDRMYVRLIKRNTPKPETVRLSKKSLVRARTLLSDFKIIK